MPYCSVCPFQDVGIGPRLPTVLFQSSLEGTKVTALCVAIGRSPRFMLKCSCSGFTPKFCIIFRDSGNRFPSRAFSKCNEFRVIDEL